MWPEKIRLRLSRNEKVVGNNSVWKALKEKYGMDYVFIGEHKISYGSDCYSIEEAKKYATIASISCLEQGTSMFEVITDKQYEFDF